MTNIIRAIDSEKFYKTKDGKIIFLAFESLEHIPYKTMERIREDIFQEANKGKSWPIGHPIEKENPANIWKSFAGTEYGLP